MQNFARLARRAVPVTVAASAGATVAQARVAPPSVRDHAAASLRFEDEWLLPSLSGDHVIFPGEEIDECCNEIGALFSLRTTPQRSAVTISEVTPDGSECSDGNVADSVIESIDAGGIRSSSNNSRQSEISVLLQITNQMLRRPGLQREVVSAMMEDEKIRNLMHTQCDNLDTYLLASGIPSNPRLLECAGSEESEVASTEADHGVSGLLQGNGLVTAIVDAVSTLVQRTGGALAFLGGWLRDRFAFLGAGPVSSDVLGAAPRAGGEGSQKKGADAVIGTVMVIVVAVVCLLLVRRPMRLRFAARA